ncbi:MAG TPA: T9SS type A sorting domain-containing protein, partial [Saprospiraceae bacterium]|nr:T9SS type A sorting domain-containing protein [Saprospiraceae bacterium]
NFNAPTQAQALRFQEIAWETIVNYQKNCLSILSPNTDYIQTDLKIYPNPSTDIITLEYDGADQTVQVFNTSGQQIMQIQSKQIDVSNLPKGLYFVKVNGQFQKIIKY